jgi:hypothetical protein
MSGRIQLNPESFINLYKQKNNIVDNPNAGVDYKKFYPRINITPPTYNIPQNNSTYNPQYSSNCYSTIQLNNPQLAFNINRKKYYESIILKNQKARESPLPSKYPPRYFLSGYNSIYDPPDISVIPY